MKRTEIRALFASAPADGASVTVCGWAKTVRDSKNIGFIELSDGSCRRYTSREATVAGTPEGLGVAAGLSEGEAPSDGAGVSVGLGLASGVCAPSS